MCPANSVNTVEEDSDGVSSSAESVSFVTLQNVNAVGAEDGPILCNLIINDANTYSSTHTMSIKLVITTVYQNCTRSLSLTKKN